MTRREDTEINVRYQRRWGQKFDFGRLIALMVKAVSDSEAFVSVYQTTRRKISKDSRFHSRRRENVKPLRKIYQDFLS